MEHNKTLLCDEEAHHLVLQVIRWCVVVLRAGHEKRVGYDEVAEHVLGGVSERLVWKEIVGLSDKTRVSVLGAW